MDDGLANDERDFLKAFEGNDGYVTARIPGRCRRLRKHGGHKAGLHVTCEKLLVTLC